MREAVPEPPQGSQHTSPRPLLEPPGGILMWIVVALELLTFSIVFIMLASWRGSEPSTFAAGQQLLDARTGLAQTLALLTSGWLVAEAVHAWRADRIGRARRFYAGGIAAGLGFVLLKVLDYANKARLGMDLDDAFGAAYFLATGFHFAHVLVGLALLTYVALRVGRRPFEDPETAVAGTALFWHMCDIAWFFLFPLFYAR
ncbi:MAG: cytochrome c oxidase subunit 3 [Myxococcota bacterium]